MGQIKPYLETAKLNLKIHLYIQLINKTLRNNLSKLNFKF